MKIEVPAWVTAVAGLVLLVAAGVVPYLWIEKGKAEQEARVYEDSMEAAIVRADSTADRVRVIRDSLHKVQDSLTMVSAELTTTRTELTGNILSTIDTLRVHVPDSAEPLLDRLRGQVDSLRDVHREEQEVWEQRFENQQQEIDRLEELYEAEHEARLQAERAQQKAMSALDPPLWKTLARGLPEAGAKLGGGVLACQHSLEACAAYAGALGIDFVFDL